MKSCHLLIPNQRLAKFQLNKAGDELSFKLNMANIENVIGAHIHKAPVGENGPIVAFLFGYSLAEPISIIGTLVEDTITEPNIFESIAGDFNAPIKAMKIKKLLYKYPLALISQVNSEDK